MLRAIGVGAATLALVPSFACSEPVGRWWAGFGQGNFEYGIHNDSAGSDTVYIACGEVPTTIEFTIGGVKPPPGSTVIVTIGVDEFELPTGSSGEFETGSHVASDIFHALWDAMREGQAMRVRLASGQSTGFTLKGTSDVLPEESCRTDFEG